MGTSFEKNFVKQSLLPINLIPFDCFFDLNYFV